MSVATPPVWSDPANATVDITTGVWAAAAVDAICSGLRLLGGADGASGIAGKPNLLVNGGFEVWQRGTSFSISTITITYTADRWATSLGGTSSVNVTQDVTNLGPYSQFALDLVYTHNATSQLVQKLEQWATYKGQSVSLSMAVKCATANAVRIGVYDGTANTVSAYHPGDGAYHVLTVSVAISAAASTLAAFVSLEASATVIVDNAYLCTGTSPLPGFVPDDPAVGLARCQRYYELLGAASSQAVVIGGIATAGAQTVYATLPWKATKAVAPTVTVASNFTLINASGQPTRFASDPTAVVLQLNSSAAGAFQAVSTGATNAVVAEANP